MRKITDEKIAEIKNNATKPKIFNGTFPLNIITDREFETLCYLIFKERIKYNDIELTGKVDKVDLMAGVGEQGFDSTLYKKGVINGLIQCKQYNNRITKPQLILEYLKFILYAIVNPELVPNRNDFTYYFVASSGFANTTITLLANFQNNILKEDIKKYCEQIIPKYQSLKDIDIDAKLDDIKKLIGSIVVEKVIPEDIDVFLKDYPIIAKTFFKIYTATDNTLIENVVSKYLEPILSSINETKLSVKDYKFRFKEYLAQVLNRYSSAQTLVFGNQQKKIEEFYYPLTLICNKDSENEIKIKTQKYTDDFIPKYKKVLICDHGGMGKSTILKWLFRSSTIENKGIPIFIELRSLTKENTIIREITKQLEPIDVALEEMVTKRLIARGGFIFFLDGYDEISKKNKNDVTRDLSNFIAKASNNLFVISSRPESALKTFGDFQEFRIERLKQEEAYELIKKIGNNNVKSLQLVEQLKNDHRHELTEFLESPLLISLLYKKFEHRETIPMQKQEFYWEVYEALFQAHDIIKGDRYEREKDSGLSLHEFHKVLRGLAYFTALLNQVEYSHAELEKFIKKANNFFPGIKFEISSFIHDITSAVPIFQKEGLKYKWSHKTLQEYFASEFICRDTKENQGKILKRLTDEENSMSYYGILDMCYEIDYKSFRKYILYPNCKEYSAFYNTYITKYTSHKHFELILNIANQLFDSKICFFEPSNEAFKLFFTKMDELKPSLEKELACQIKSMEIKIGAIEPKEAKQFIKTAIVKVSKGFPLKRFLREKKSNLLLKDKKIKGDNNSIKSIEIKYNKTLEGVDFYFLPENIDSFLEQHLNEIETYFVSIRDSVYNIKECDRLIFEVEKENKIEENANFFFEGLN